MTGPPLFEAIRPLQPADVGEVAALLHSLANQFIVHQMAPEQASTFLRENDAAAITRLLAQGFVYHVAQVDGQLAGFIGMRAGTHVYHLFVGTDWQQRGLARALWQTARAAAIAGGAAPPFTVNASTYAVPAYQRLGFVASAPLAEKNGLQFQPMRWDGP